MQHNSNKPIDRPLIFGEVLFDCFPDQRVLGGAPFNVAWNLRGLGLNPLIVTAVGDDSLGQEVSRRVQDWGLDSSGLQICKGRPTGRVDIETLDGEPSYQFWDNVAFDSITYDDALIETACPSLLYHGSLALRYPTSLATLDRIRAKLAEKIPVFVDVNVRLPHFDPKILPKILNNADHVKLNHDELALLSDEDPRLPPTSTHRWDRRRILGERLIQRYKIGNLWITAAEEGAAYLNASGEFLVSEAPLVEDLVDTVGAGDALTAVIVRGLLNACPAKTILTDGTQFASRVCSIRGAITDDIQFYREFRMCVERSPEH